MDASLALQTAVFTALSGDAPLAALVTGVWDRPPAGTALPYIEIGEIAAVDNGATSMEGFEHTIEIQIWSRAKGKAELFSIMEKVDAVLHDATLTLTGHTLVSLTRQNRRTLQDADPAIGRGVMDYRAITEAL